jgi:hypothetical protein
MMPLRTQRSINRIEAMAIRNAASDRRSIASGKVANA